MQGLSVFFALLLIGYGFAAAGLLGALTGVVAAVGVGSGLAIARAERGTGVAHTGAMRGAQRLGGTLAALCCMAGAFYGGWRFGWLWAVAGYILGAAVALLVGLAVAPKSNRSERATIAATLPAIGGRGISERSGFIPEWDDEIRSPVTGLPLRIATGPLKSPSGNHYWVTLILGLSQSASGAGIAVTPKLSFVRNERADAHIVHATVVQVVSTNAPDTWMTELPDLFPESGSNEDIRGLLLELRARLLR